ncbi:hypothetical protein Nepgr_003952 [Nepenthes gracilis]|uniref:Uncharacterized protein n=1 Tax=Nepenthes gracilis TaxID=150966 RepID=A0AAD3XEF8_NEPGR|nr:hypothetical protein Nepgr_003952 [Nepenthes gracilis]
MFSDVTPRWPRNLASLLLLWLLPIVAFSSSWLPGVSPLVVYSAIAVVEDAARLVDLLSVEVNLIHAPVSVNLRSTALDGHVEGNHVKLDGVSGVMVWLVTNLGQKFPSMLLMLVKDDLQLAGVAPFSLPAF